MEYTAELYTGRGHILRPGSLFCLSKKLVHVLVVDGEVAATGELRHGCPAADGQHEAGHGAEPH